MSPATSDRRERRLPAAGRSRCVRCCGSRPRRRVPPFTNSAYGSPGVSFEQHVVDALEEVLHQRRSCTRSSRACRARSPSHQRTSSASASGARAHAHLDVVDLVARRARDHGVGHRLRRARTRVEHDEQMPRARSLTPGVAPGTRRGRTRGARGRRRRGRRRCAACAKRQPAVDACEPVAVAAGDDRLQRQRRRLLEHDERRAGRRGPAASSMSTITFAVR